MKFYIWPSIQEKERAKDTEPRFIKTYTFIWTAKRSFGISSDAENYTWMFKLLITGLVLQKKFQSTALKGKGRPSLSVPGKTSMIKQTHWMIPNEWQVEVPLFPRAAITLPAIPSLCFTGPPSLYLQSMGFGLGLHEPAFLYLLIHIYMPCLFLNR